MSTATTTPVRSATKHQAALIAEHLDIQARQAELDEALTIVNARLIASIGVGNTVASELAQVTPTTQTSFDIDFDALVEAKPYWARKVTKKAFDKAKFNLLRKANEVPADVLAMAVEKTSKPFLRVTLRQPEAKA